MGNTRAKPRTEEHKRAEAVQTALATEFVHQIVETEATAVVTAPKVLALAKVEQLAVTQLSRGGHELTKIDYVMILMALLHTSQIDQFIVLTVDELRRRIRETVYIPAVEHVVRGVRVSSV